MNAEAHQHFQRRIDEILVAGESLQSHPLLEQHLRTCSECEQYLNHSRKVISALGAFTFDVDPWLEAKVFHAIGLRTRQDQPRLLNRRLLFQVCCLAVVFILLGSVLDLWAARLFEPLVSTSQGHLQQNILDFWVAPSSLLLLVFPMLPLLTRQRGRIA